MDEKLFYHVYVLVDALDEIPDTDGRKDACKILDELSQRSRAHIITTSRREQDIADYMSECQRIKDISIQKSEVDHDIRLWIRERLRDDRKLKKWSSIHGEIEAALSKEADGMFRWAAYQLDSLKKCLSAKSVQKALKTLPKTLDETYERMLLAIDEEYQHVALEALRWLCFSTEVLKISELAEAAVFSAVAQAPSKEAPFEVSFDPGERIEDPLDILGILSGLVVTRAPVQRIISSKSNDRRPQVRDSAESNHYPSEGYHTNDDSLNRSNWGCSDDQAPRHESLVVRREVGPSTIKTSKILLAHFSVKEYLVSGRLRSQVRQFAIDESRAHRLLATNCLYYGLCSAVMLGATRTGENAQQSIARYKKKHNTSYPLLHYASSKWLQHTKRVAYEPELNGFILSLFDAGIQVQSCLLLQHLERFDQEFSDTLTPLYVLSTLGLYLPLKKLIESGPDMNKREGHYGSALQAASYRSRKSIVRLLLDHGADVNIKGGRFDSALQAASYRGSESIVQLLLDHGADANAQGGKYETALRAASSQGHKNVMQILLDHGANANSQGGGIYSTPTQAALAGRHAEVSVLLLERGAILTVYEGGTEAQAVLMRKDFKKFVETQLCDKVYDGDVGAQMW